MNRVRTPGDGPTCWCEQPATFGGFCNAHYNTDTGKYIGPPTPKDPPIATYRITLPESTEDLGKWLERNNAHIEVGCQLGKYHVTVTKNYPSSYTESGDISVTKRSEVTVSAYGDMFQETLSAALRRANEVQP